MTSKDFSGKFILVSPTHGVQSINTETNPNHTAHPRTRP